MKHKHRPYTLIPVLFLVAAMTVQAQPNGEIFDSIRNSDYETLNTLIANGEDINKADKSKNTPLMVAAKIGDSMIVDALLSRQADPNLRNRAGATALMLAAKYGHGHIVEKLLAFGADPLIENHSGIRASRFASAYDHQEVYRMLLDAESEALKGKEVTPNTVSVPE